MRRRRRSTQGWQEWAPAMGVGSGVIGAAVVMGVDWGVGTAVGVGVSTGVDAVGD